MPQANIEPSRDITVTKTNRLRFLKRPVTLGAHAVRTAALSAAMMTLFTCPAFTWPAQAQGAPSPSAQTSRGQTQTAAALDAQQQLILDVVMRPDGYVTKDMHTAFWKALPQAIRKDKDAWQAYRTALLARLDAATRFQKETWHSMALSAEAGTVRFTPGFEAARTAALDASGSAPALFGVASADQLLKAAAAGADVPTANGPEPVSPDLVREALSRFDAASARLALLLGADWAPKAEARPYPPAPLSITSDLPFLIEIDRRPSRTGDHSLMTVTLLSRREARELVFVTYTEFSGPWRDKRTGLERLARAALAKAGIGDGAFKAKQWNKRFSVLAEGGASGEETEIHGAARVVDWPDRRAALTILALSPRSARAARSLRDETEAQIALNE